jgi:hypothetical protein
MALAVGVAAGLMAPQPIAGQAQSAQPKAAASAPAKPWTGKTPEGVPDLQGYWTNNSYTPLQRAAGVTKEFYTPEELKEAEKRSAAREAEQTVPGTTGDVHYDFTQFALDRSQTRLTDNLRTSMITDPANGQLPARVGAAAAAPGGGGGGRGGGARGGGGAAAAPGAAPAAAGGGRGAAGAAGGGARGGGGGGGGNQYDSVQNIPIGSRCIWTGSTGPIMMPPGYNPAYQISQGPGVVMILIENQHEVRIIPTDNRPHAPSQVKPWLGDSTGHWEGNTLVVETVNYNPRVLTGTFQGTSDQLKVTERFTRTSEDSFRYEFTVDDPKTWVQPWKGEMPFVKINGPVFEHACHEGNYGIANTLQAVRNEEKKAAEAAKAAQPK